MRPPEILLAVLAYGALSVWYTWPLARMGADHVFDSSGLLLADAYYLMWVLAWGAHALATDPTRVFQGNVAYPAAYVVTGSEHLVGAQPLFAPVWAASGNPVLGLNTVILVSFVATALAMHALVRRWTGSVAAAVAATIAFTFAPWRIDLGRPYLLQMQYVPLLLLLLDRALDRGSIRSAMAAGLVLGLQILTSFWVGYMSVVAVTLYALMHLAASAGRWPRTTWRAAVLVPLAAVPIVLPAVIAYANAAMRAALPAADPQSKLLATTSLLVGTPGAVIERYVGWGTLVIAILGCLGIVRAAPIERRRLIALGLCAVVGLAIAAGPPGIAGMSPYAWLAVLVPGFDRLRAPVRFGALSGFALSVLAGYGVARLAHMASPLVRGTATAIALGAMAWPLVVHDPLIARDVATGSRIPKAYRWLAERGEGGTLLELPIGPRLGVARNMAAARAMYMSTYHWLPLVNAHTGFPLPTYALTETWAQQLPSPDALRALTACTGLRWILLHGSDPRFSKIAEVSGVELRARFPVETLRREDLLYEVSLPADDECRRRLLEPSTVDSTSDGEPRGWVAVEGLSDTLARGLDSRIMLEVENGDDRPWQAVTLSRRDRVQIAARWLMPSDRAEYDREDVLLPADVAPGTRLRFEAWLQHPRRPGSYLLEIGLVRGETASAVVARSIRAE